MKMKNLRKENSYYSAYLCLGLGDKLTKTEKLLKREENQKGRKK